MAKKLTLIKRTDPICPACNAMESMLDAEGVEYDTIDITEEPEAVEKYDLTGVPLMLIENEFGEITDRLSGFHPVDAVKAKLSY